ncbi:glutathione hydrolase 1 proenzyme-like [Chrysoperla carnea]|uniref:glutathione hydrolase 1 proenzyme-like n=1 Tax=Chrysoperla carnea TaxID=189513 RepID=UPI001D08670E|nr:glutathione hydrolase 1 proenzyme-like [Chrysoperla carnea]
MKATILTIFTIAIVMLSESNASEKKGTKAKKRNVIVTNNPLCTSIAKQLVSKGGNAREVFIAVSLCEGMVHPMDSGLGGGFQAVYYSKSKGKKTALYINSREQSPSNASFADYELIGGNSVGIPSMLKGYETLYNLDKENNKLKWSEIIAPVIKLCDTGFDMSKTTHEAFKSIQNVSHVWDKIINVNMATKTCKNRLFCKLLRQISEDGPSSSMYKKGGKLHKLVMEDLSETTSFITSKDIRNYKVKVKKPATGKFGKYTVYTTRVPGSGYSVLLALKMMERVKALMKKDATQTEKIVYLLKILKYTYAFQPHIRELRNATIHKIINKAGKILGTGIVKNGIDISSTIPRKFGDVKLARMISPLDFGTTNVVIKIGHTAISATSTINHTFGSGILSKTMGFFYNNQMRDFSDANWRRKGKPLRNAPGPNKVPSSKISGTIMVDEDGKPVFQIGAAGGGKILSAIVNTLYNYFVLNYSLEKAVQTCRFMPKFNYHKNHVTYMYECMREEDVANQLRAKGVDFQLVVESGYSAATALSQIRSKSEAAYDKRRGGKALLS